MVDQNQEKAVRYLETILPLRIISNNHELKNSQVISCTAKSSKSLDGFLSCIYQVCLVLEDEITERQQTLNLIAKLMKKIEGLDDTEIMTFNELKFYTDFLPNFSKYAKSGGVDAKWAPKFYYGIYEIEQELGDGESPDGVFVFEDLTSEGFRMGPRAGLDEKHVMLMTESIAELHAASYASKIQGRDVYEEFVTSLKPFLFCHDDRVAPWDAFYNIALLRLYRHVTTADHIAEDFKEAVCKVYKKFVPKPSSLLQTFVDEDQGFNIIIHGDYNRNNVMFKYDADEGFDNPIGVKMFDFQWTKYASPALDLSFFMYQNIGPEILPKIWNKVLTTYHNTLIKTLTAILKCNKDDPRLERLNYESFLLHFSKHAFYGCLIAAWFLPVMLADLETCNNVEAVLNKDMFSQEAIDVILPAGGESALKRVSDNMEHAFKNGYFRRLLD